MFQQYLRLRLTTDLVDKRPSYQHRNRLYFRDWWTRTSHHRYQSQPRTIAIFSRQELVPRGIFHCTKCRQFLQTHWDGQWNQHKRKKQCICACARWLFGCAMQDNCWNQHKLRHSCKDCLHNCEKLSCYARQFIAETNTTMDTLECLVTIARKLSWNARQLLMKPTQPWALLEGLCLVTIARKLGCNARQFLLKPTQPWALLQELYLVTIARKLGDCLNYESWIVDKQPHFLLGSLCGAERGPVV